MNLILRSVRKSYPDFRLEVDLEVTSGELVTLLGPSGCGKTTTLRMVAGLEQPDAGSIILGDRVVNGVPAHQREVGLVFQDYGLFPHMRVNENVAFGPNMHGWSKERTRARVFELLSMVQLPGAAKRKVDELSGGEQQRVALARALAPDPAVLLLDEPLSALDRKLRLELRQELRLIQRRLGVTTVYVTHDQEEALALSDRVVVMNRGEVVQKGTPQEIWRKPGDLFVADFMGRSNRIAGEITGRHEQYACVRTPEGLVFSGGPEDMAGPVVVTFRAESCLAGPVPSGWNRISGTVIDSEYRGDDHVIRLESAGGVLTSRWTEGLPPHPGDTVECGFPPESCWAIPGEPAGPRSPATPG